MCVCVCVCVGGGGGGEGERKFKVGADMEGKEGKGREGGHRREWWWGGGGGGMGERGRGVMEENQGSWDMEGTQLISSAFKNIPCCYMEIYGLYAP